MGWKVTEELIADSKNVQEIEIGLSLRRKAANQRIGGGRTCAAPCLTKRTLSLFFFEIVFFLCQALSVLYHLTDI